MHTNEAKYAEQLDQLRKKVVISDKEYAAAHAIVGVADFISKLALETERLSKENTLLQQKVVNLTYALFWLTLLILIVSIPAAWQSYRQMFGL